MYSLVGMSLVPVFSSLLLPLAVLSLLPFSVTSECVYSDVILVDQNAGYDNVSCLTPNSSLPCRSLTYALRGFRRDSTSYNLGQGTFTLDSSVPQFTDVNCLGIIGSNDTSVVCQENAGLAFQNVSFITIQSISFANCGAIRNSTSRNYSDGNPYSLSTFRVVLYFYLCHHVTFDKVVVANSTAATGVVMYDTTGLIIITDSKFINNSMLNSSTSLVGGGGGGGFYVEFTYCLPGYYCNNANTTTNNVGSTYCFTDCTFYNNVAVYAVDQQKHSPMIIPSQNNHVAFGRGGGLSFFFNGYASENNIAIIQCNFSSNHAFMGGGLFVEFHDTSFGNSVGLSNCIFWNNNATEGAGARIGQFVLTTAGTAFNNVTFVYCFFRNNKGYYGGGLAIEPALQNANQISSVAYFLFQNCNFTNNVATLGSAIYASLFTLVTEGLPPSINFNYTTIQNNGVNGVNVLNPYNEYGTVHLHLVPVKFISFVQFINNSGSALALVATHADFSSCTTVEFIRNSGPKGGAIALLGASWLLIGKNTSMTFIGNNATIDGGAIYNLYIEKENFSTSTNCFLKYSDPTISPEKWTANFKFVNNTNSISFNAIHSTSILPCGVISGKNDPNSIFCWNDAYWNYGGLKCKDLITTDASNLSLISEPSAYPGQVVQLPFSITDELGHDVLNQTVFTGLVSNTQVAKLSTPVTYISSGYVQFSGNESGNITLTLNSAGNSHLYASINVSIMLCPPGLELLSNDINSNCGCNPTSTYGGMVLCLGPGAGQENSKSPPALIQRGTWIGHVDNSSTLYVGHCPPGYCDGSNDTVLLGGYIKLPTTDEQLDETICSNSRTGILCGECKEGYCISINPLLQCLPCNQSDVVINIFQYIGVVYVPLLVFFIVIILSKARLTSGTANALIVYSQVISSTFDLTVAGSIGRGYSYASSLAKSYRFVYGIFNLDFISTLVPPFFVSEHMNALDSIALNYVVALCPLLMILIMFLSIKLLTARCFLCCARFRVTASPMMAFASFLLLSYNKLTVTSTTILSINTLITSNGSYSAYERVYSAGQLSVTDVAIYVIVAYFCLLVPIFLPIILLGYPVHFFERVLMKVPFFKRHYPADKVSIFLDTFQGDFKDNRRFYASFYFFFRIMIAVEYIWAVTHSTQIILQQGTCVLMILFIAILRPYKARVLNYVDAMIFTNMAILGSISMYMLQNPVSSTNPTPLIIQYVLVMTPAVVYISVSIVVAIGRWKGKRLPFISSRTTSNIESGKEIVASIDEKSNASVQHSDEEDALIDRSKEANTYTHLD